MKKLVQISLLVALSFMITSGGAKKAPKRFTNLDYLGIGYDALLGNPMDHKRDPGFQAAIFDLQFNDKKGKFLSVDGRWQFPDYVSGWSDEGCTHETKASEVSGSQSYHSMLSNSVKVEGGFGPVSFSASTAWSEAKDHFEKHHEVFVDVVSMCTKYKAELQTKAHVLKDSFIEDVENLPTKVVRKAPEYMRFIKTYGTHYVSEVEMGSLAVEHSSFSQVAWSDMKSKKIDISAGASASFMGAHGGFEASHGSDKSSKETFDSKKSSSECYYKGGKPPTDSNWLTWSQTAGDEPAPLTYVLLPNYELLTPKYFPKAKTDPQYKADLEMKRKSLNESYGLYCGIVNCGMPNPDAKPVLMDQHESPIKNVDSSQCNPGYQLLSCGIGNTAVSKEEVYRYSIPVSNSECKCHADNGATCQAACTNSVEGFQIVQSGWKTGYSRANCPAGKNLLGCHIEASDSGKVQQSPDLWRAYFPNKDGTGCTCFSTAYDGGNCIATCASGVSISRVSHQASKGGTIHVECPDKPQLFALGCGIKPDGIEEDMDLDDKRRYARISSLTSCECGDANGATCYAICGLFQG